MSDESHDVRKDVKKYMIIFGALIVGTIVTVLANEIDFSKYFHDHGTALKVTIAVALFIAGIKGFLVAAYFMHLMSERKIIYCILAFTVFFFAGLMYLTLWSSEPENMIHFQHATQASP
jgi:caa(3)-type oxidase subunit IV